MITAIPTENWLDFIGISVDSQCAEGMKFIMNLILPDTHEKFLIEMSNATLTNIKGYQSNNPDLSITVNRADLNQAMLGLTSFPELEQAGKAKFVGNHAVFEKLKSTLTQFTPNFEIMPGTLNARSTPASQKSSLSEKFIQNTKPFEFPISSEKED